MKTTIIIFVFCLCLAITSPAFAQEFRTFNQIPTPGRAPDGAKPVQSIESVSASSIQNAAEQIVNAWNSGNISQNLAENFYDKTRLLDSINTNVPKDATIRLLSLQGGQTLNQYERINTSGKKEIISTISVNANTQIEFNDAQKGFRRLEGTNEYVLRIVEEVE